MIGCNDLLHHLHDPAVLWQAVGMWVGPGALVVVSDLCRPPNPEALQELVERHAADAPLFSGATLSTPWQQPSCLRRWKLSWRRQG